MLVTNIDRLVGWPFEDVGRGKQHRGGGLRDRIQSEGNPHWDPIRKNKSSTQMVF